MWGFVPESRNTESTGQTGFWETRDLPRFGDEYLPEGDTVGDDPGSRVWSRWRDPWQLKVQAAVAGGTRNEPTTSSEARNSENLQPRRRRTRSSPRKHLRAEQTLRQPLLLSSQVWVQVGQGAAASWRHLVDDWRKQQTEEKLATKKTQKP